MLLFKISMSHRKSSQSESKRSIFLFLDKCCEPRHTVHSSSLTLPVHYLFQELYVVYVVAQRREDSTTGKYNTDTVDVQTLETPCLI